MPNVDHCSWCGKVCDCEFHSFACPCREARFKGMEDWLRNFVDKDGFIGAAEHDQARALLKEEPAMEAVNEREVN